MINFKVDFNGRCNEGKPYYDVQSYSFDFKPRSSYEAMARINYLELGFNSYNGRILHAIGLCAYHSWVKTEKNPPAYKRGSLIAEAKIKRELKVYDIESEDWPVQFNPVTGWICIGTPYENNEFEAVEFATDTIAIIKNKNLKAVWIKPRNLIHEFLANDIKI